MIIEDYYGFGGKKQGVEEPIRQKSSSRTERPQKNLIITSKSPLRTLKRTQLSKEKLNSRNAKKSKSRKTQQANLQVRSPSKHQSSNAIIDADQRERTDSDQQEIEMMTKKYDNYKNTDSYEFREAEQSQHNSYLSSQHHEQYNQRGYRFQKQTPARTNRFQNEEIESYAKNYHSLSRGRNQSFLVHFQRQGPAPNAIQRYIQNHSSSNDIRVKKSRSLGAKFKPYKMHTFYNADMKQYYNYNEEGYMTDRQYELLNRIEEKALRAFEKAVNQHSERKTTKRPRLSKPFDIQESSKIQHKNSDILQSLKNDEDYNKLTPLSSRKELSSKAKRDSKPGESISKAKSNEKSSHNYDDYQMSISSKSKEQSSQHLQGEKPVQPNIFTNFAREKEDSQEDNQLLQFRPFVKKEAPPKLEIEREESVKRSSEISNEKSIDMMEINSNCKPNALQVKERNEFIDDNRSLGIDTIKNHKIKSDPQLQDAKSDRDSNLDISSSNSSSSQPSSSQPPSHSPSDKRSSRKESNVEGRQSDKFDFNRNKLKKSYSLSEPYSESSMNDPKKIENHLSSKDIPVNFKKAPLPSENQAMASSKDSIGLDANNTSNNSQKVKIKRLTRVSKKAADLPEEHHFQDTLDALGVQSFQNNESNEPIQIKVRAADRHSKISERSEAEQASLSHASRLKEKHSSSSFRQRSQASIAYRSKMRNSQHGSDIEYDLFAEVHEFLGGEEEQHDIRKGKEIKELIPDELDSVLEKIEEHLYMLTCIAEIILLVPEVYDFETIYVKGKDWIFLEVFLTLKQFAFQRGRVVAALKGGKNCFKLLNFTIEDHVLKKYLSRVEITNLVEVVEASNVQLDRLIADFFNFLVKLNKQGYVNDPYINLRPFKMNDDLVVLLTEYIHEVETLLNKKEDEFKGGSIESDDQEEEEIMMMLNQRVFRLMEITFVMANLAGREIKAFQKDQTLFRDEEQFKNYLFQNEALFKETVKFFK